MDSSFSPSSKDAKRACLLLQRYFEKKITDEEAEELAIFWDKTPQFDDLALKSLEIEQVLHFFGRQESSPLMTPDRFVALRPEGSPFCRHEAEENLSNEKNLWKEFNLDMDELIRLANDSPSLSERVSETNLKKNFLCQNTLKTVRDRKPSRFLYVIAVFLPVIISSVIFFEFFAPSIPAKKTSVSFHPIASITHALDLEFPDSDDPRNTLKTGQSIETDKIRFDSGLMELNMRSGVRIVVEGPTEINLIGPNKLFCEKGHLSVFVPKGAEGFEIMTPLVNVLDLGTAFTLSVDEKGVETHVIQGKVELIKPLAGKTLLEMGNATRIDSDGKIRQMKASADRYVDRQEVLRRVKQSQEKQKKQWDKVFKKFADDSSLLVDFDFAGDSSGDASRQSRSRIVNLSELGRSRYGDGNLLGGSREPGNLCSDSCVSFRQRNDAVALNIEPELRSLTLWASVHPESLDRFTHILFASRKLGDGSVLWQISRDGNLQFSVQAETKNAANKFASPPFFQARHCGAWYQIAMVFDAEARKVSHYIDGRKIGENLVSQDLSINIDTATIGNGFLGRSEMSTNCSFGGRIERFLIFDRALSEVEIIGLSEAFSY